MRAMRAVTIAVAVLVGFSAIALQAEVTYAVDNGTLGIRPSDGADFYHLRVRPGETLKVASIVTNRSAVPVTLLTYPVDAVTTDGGSFALKSQSDDREGVGRWTTTPATQIVVAPESQQRVPLAITVPLGTAPGDYEGGLIIQNVAVAGTTTDSHGTSVRIDVVQRQGVRIYLTVPGTAKKTLTVKNLAWETNGANTVFALTLKNTGNTTLHPTAVLNVSRWFSKNTELKFAAPESVPPGATVALTGTLASAPLVQIGSARAVITSGAGTTSAESSLLQIPWPVSLGIAVLLVVLAVSTWLLVRFFRRVTSAFAQVARLDATP